MTPTGKKRSENADTLINARIYYGALEVNGERVYCDGKPLKAEDLLDVLSRHYGKDLAAAING
ncbi:hypothetical protein VRRI112168_02330 [Vreelandella rituensis]|uniref:hypothetical protein n=1 Tax=Vreelandella rituensis TaxID=2282306 RepID=UPI0011C07FB9|nr:hypothetical protein [Halomonas rituensis]